jgi:hypothetical protein
MVGVPVCGLLTREARINPIMAPGAALRRAIAKFHGLLREGKNRKHPVEIAFLSENAGDRWTLPEEQL